MSRRTRPLVVVGPKTLRKRLSDTMECLFPGSTGVPPRFDLRIEEFPEKEGAVWRAGAIAVSPYRVKHYCGAPPYALRVECEDRTVTRSEEHTSELQSLMRISYAVFCLKKKNQKQNERAP